MLIKSVTYTYNVGWSDCLNAMNDSLTELRYFSIVGENHKSAVAEEMTTVTQADRYLDFKSGLYRAVIDRKFRGAAVDLSSHISQMAIAGPASLGTNHLMAMSRQYQEDAQALRDLLNKIAQRNTAIGKKGLICESCVTRGIDGARLVLFVNCLTHTHNASIRREE